MVYFIITSLMFSVFEVVSKNIRISPFNLTFIRFFLGGSLLLPVAMAKLIKARQKINKAYIIKMWLLGMLLMVSCILLQISLINTTVSFCVFIYSLNAIFTAFAGWIFLKQRPSSVIWLTCAVALVGLLIITDPFKGALNLYSLVALTSAILYSIFNTLLFKSSKNCGNLVSTALSIFLGSISLGVVLTLTGANPAHGLNGSNIAQILFLGVVCSAGVYVMYYKTMEVTSVSVASMVFLIKPVLATVLAAFFLKEIPSLTFLAGSLLILIGVSITLFDKIKKSRGIKIPAGDKPVEE